jgi:hypothetical protein
MFMPPIVDRQPVCGYALVFSFAGLPLAKCRQGVKQAIVLGEPGFQIGESRRAPQSAASVTASSAMNRSTIGSTCSLDPDADDGGDLVQQFVDRSLPSRRGLPG